MAHMACVLPVPDIPNDSTIDEVTLTESVVLLSDLGQGPVVLEGLPSLAVRELRCPSQTVHPSDLGPLLHHLHLASKSIGMTGLAEPSNGLGRQRGQPERQGRELR